jgi:hypothetical protein
VSDSEKKMDREEATRNRAYAIWLDEGGVDGRDKEHWREAELQIDRETSLPSVSNADSLKERDAPEWKKIDR